MDIDEFVQMGREENIPKEENCCDNELMKCVEENEKSKNEITWMSAIYDDLAKIKDYILESEITEDQWKDFVGALLGWSQYVILKARGRISTSSSAPPVPPAPPKSRRQLYHEYLTSPEWAEIRTAKLEEAEYRCQVCNVQNLFGGKALNVHHRTYERIFHELLTDLVVLCADCHEIFHAAGKLAKIEE